jgi:arylsulfatase A-like enzyme
MSHGNSLYRELIHVPLIMVGPGIPVHTAVERPVSMTWLAPTLLSLTGSSSAQFSGPAMNLNWTGPAQSTWPAPVSEVAQMYQDPNAPNYSGALVSVVTSKWHLIAGGKNGEELFAWGGDSAEKHNLSNAQPAVAEMLRAELQRVEAQANGMQNPANGPAERQRINDYLKALGYVPESKR